MKKILLLFVTLLFVIQIVFAQNDPGHDSLYVLKIGDVISGNLNVTGDLTANQFLPQQQIHADNLVIRADGTTSTKSNRIVATSSSVLSIVSPELRLNYGTGGEILIGTEGVPTSVLIQGTLKLNNTNVCLSNGTNCPSLESGGFEGTLGVGSGGTGRTSLTEGNLLVGAGTSAVNFMAPGSNGQVLVVRTGSWTSDGLIASDIPNLDAGKITSGTLVAAIGGTGVSSCSNGQILTWDESQWICSAYGGGDMTSWTLAGDSGTSQTIGEGDTVTIIGGTGINTVASSGNNLTINLDTSYADGRYVEIGGDTMTGALEFGTGTTLGVAYNASGDELVIGNISAFI